MDLPHYDLFADVFAYPGPDYPEAVAKAVRACAGSHPSAAEHLERFEAGVPMGDVRATQELHTRTFDVQAIATLDIGYTLFGDDYKRGAMLANLNGEHRRAGNLVEAELADHLPNILRLLPRMPDAEFREELVSELVAPAVRRMIAEFSPTNMAKKDLLYKRHHKTVIETDDATRTIYLEALHALHDVLASDFVITENPIVDKTSAFMHGVGTELRIEDCDDCSSAATGKGT